MSMKPELKSPNNLPIIGIKLDGGEVSDFDFKRQDDTSLYQLPNGNYDKVDRSAGYMILIDSEGGEWSALDVEFHSL